MTRSVLPILASAMLAACNTPSTPPPTSTTPTPTTPTTAGPTQIMLPSLAGSMPQLFSGMVTLSGDSGAGTATFTQAPLAADDGSVVAPGSGAFSVQLAATTYASASAQSIFGVFPDDGGTQYVVVGDIDDDPVSHRVQVVYGVFLQSDFQAGADLALDGVSRYAIFAAGDETAEDPDTIAIATSGTIHLGAAATLAGPIDATLSGTFVAGEIDPGSGSPDGGTAGPGPGDPPAPTAGMHTLTVDPATYAQCEGTLAGHEADFAALTPAALNVQTTYTVNVTTFPGQVVLDGGGQLAAAFGSDPLVLTVDQGTWNEHTTFSPTPGPDGTQLIDSVLFLDESRTPGTGAIGFAWVLPDYANACLASWSFTLTP